jgi:propionate CoA-transferase
MGKFVSAEEVVKMIPDGVTVATVAMTLTSVCEEILKALEASFLNTGHPRDLKLVHSAGQSDRKRGLTHLAHEGLLSRIYGAHWGLCPALMELISENKVEAFCMPQGQMAQLYREMASGFPGKLSKVGLGTFVDPRAEGGKMNDRTKKLPDIIKVVEFNDEEYLLYPEIPLDFVVLRGTTADEVGNITTEEEGMKLECLAAAMAAKRFGGKVIAQVKRVAQHGTLHPKQVIVPGVFIDAIVVCNNPLEDHRQTSSWFYDPAYCGDLHVPMGNISSLPLSMRKVIGRRAMMELYSGAIINLGTGIPNDVVGPIAAEEGITNDITVTVESGIYSGVPAGGIDFGIAANMDALIEHAAQFDFYTGVGVDFTFMGAGEMDEFGNVNATRFGKRAPGAGGFIDITQNAKNVVFCSTFTAAGLEVEFNSGGVRIVKEGTVKKLVKQVQQISFNGQIACKKKQNVFFVTERAVFQWKPEGPVLIEIASGVDLEKDIIDQMEFRPLIAKELKIINPIIYKKEKFGLKEIIEVKLK